LPESISNWQFELFDLIGTKTLAAEFSSQGGLNKLLMNTINNGIYLYKIKNKEGVFYSGRFMIVK
jgi:hypothetical protein